MANLRSELENRRSRGRGLSSFHPALTPGWTVPVKKFSASSFSKFQECPRAWQKRYILDEREPSHERQVLGRAFHAAMSFNWNCKALSEKDLPAASVVEFFNDVAWPGELVQDEDIVWDKGEDYCIEMGEKLIKHYMASKPEIYPQATELEISMELSDIPIPIVGIADCITKSGNVIDLKTAARAMGAPKTQWKLQSWIYQMATGGNLQWHVITKTKEPALIVFDEPKPPAHAKDHLTWLAKQINWCYNEYGHKDPWPTLGIGHDWACKSCFYRKDCPAWTN